MTGGSKAEKNPIGVRTTDVQRMPRRSAITGAAKVRGWLNYFTIKGVSYVTMSKKRLRVYLQQKLNRYFNRKSQRRCRLYRQKAFEVLVQKKGLIDPTKYAY